MPHALDPAVVEEARRLRRQGESLTTIQRALGISYGSAHRLTKGICPEKERSPEVRGKIAAAKDALHEQWVRDAPRGECETPGCDRPGCEIDYGDCHCGCGELAPLAPDDNRTRNYVRGEPLLYTRRCQRSADTLMAAENAEPLLKALELADISRIQVTRRAKPKLGKGVVSDLILIEGYRLQRVYCERIVSVLREAFEEKGLDTSALTLERLFTYDRPANEPPAGQRARRTKRQRDPIPPNKRGDGRHFKQASADAAVLLAGKGWTREQSAEFLERSPSIVTRRVELGRLPEPDVLKVGALRFKVFDPAAVKRLARLEQTSEDAWARNMRDPEFVLRWASKRYGDVERALELVEKTKERNRRHAKIRVGTGRPKSPGPLAHHYEWDQLFEEKSRELHQDYRERSALGLLEDFDRPPSQPDIALAVAEDERGLRHLPAHYRIWDANSGRWVLRADLADAAAHTVRMAVKRLQIARTETRAA